MPLQDSHQIISVDDHLVEHPRVWLDRLPARRHDDAPQIREVDGAQLWHYNDTRFATIGLNAVAGKPRADWGVDPIRYEDMIPGCYDPELRVKDMDVDGVQSALCFPSFPGFAGSTFFHGKDKELAALCIRAWNDFYIDEWCATAPDRYIPLGILPFWDIGATVTEARRLLDKGPAPCRSPTPCQCSICPPSTPIIGTRCGRCAPTQTFRCRCTSAPVDTCRDSRSPAHLSRRRP